MIMYRELYFAQGQEASPLLDFLDDFGAPALLDFMANADMFNENGDEAPQPCAGGFDRLEVVDNFVISYNNRLCSLGVERFS